MTRSAALACSGLPLRIQEVAFGGWTPTGTEDTSE